MTVALSICLFATVNDSTEAGIKASVGSVGDSYDNALAETINGLYKTEVIRKRGPWRNVDQVEYATLEMVSTGSTIDAYSNPLVIYRLLNMRRCIIKIDAQAVAA